MSKDNPVRVKSPLGDDLLFRSMAWTDEIGRLTVCELDLVSPREDIEIDDLLGKDMTVEINLRDDGTRYFHGYVSEMSQEGMEGELHCYSVVLRPWFWFLTQTTDCRIFQEKTVPEIIKELFRESGFPDFEETLSGKYRKWEYCVQYRETDFNFLSRLMEQEGIYYYFRHEDGKDILVLSDGYGGHDAIPGYDKIPYFPPSENVVREEHVFGWKLSRAVKSGKFALSAYHFMKPRADLKVSKAASRKHAMADYEVFDYPGEYFETSEGDAYVKTRMEELQSQYERVHGETDAMGLFAGGLFKLTEYPRDDQNREYLVCSTRQTLEITNYDSSGSDTSFACSFEAIASSEPFRAERRTPKPIVAGPQSAIVTGPSGEEIHTDEYGRVKVQFTWDRLGKKDEKSSCWIRVAQVWAGAQWGGMTIPRIGQEVLVHFIEGDPDRPIVTGRVYNADNMPPYELPANKTQSTLKTRSSKGGGAENFNEIRFEDKAGAEEMYIHAEKDQNIVVENNQTIFIGFDGKSPGDRTEKIHNDRSLEVGRDKSEKVARNKSIEVQGDHQEKIGKSMNVMVAKNLTETVAVNYAETVGAAMELSVGGGMTVAVGAALSETVGGTKSESVGSTKSETIGSTRTLEVGKDLVEEVKDNARLTVGKDMEEVVQGKRRSEVSKEYSFKAKKIQVEAADEIAFKTGSATITLKKSGDITISGKKIDIKGSGDVVIKGSKITGN